MRSAALLNRIATTDATFTQAGDTWTGKCLICNGWVSFQARTGFGANVEHITPRTLGGSNDLLNLGITHPRCNGEKGRHWDAKHRTADPVRYQEIVDRLRAERRRRWRDPAALPPAALET
jgi:5-methylcytosine-specific restriction endonuclease McrA